MRRIECATAEAAFAGATSFDALTVGEAGTVNVNAAMTVTNATKVNGGTLNVNDDKTLTTGDLTLYAKYEDCDHAASTAQPTCTESAVCSICELTLPALGHDYRFDSFVWGDNYTAQVKLICANDPDHETLEDVRVEKVTKAPTATKDGKIVYIASYDEGDVTYTDTQTVVLPATDVQICPYCGQPYSGALGAVGAALHGLIWLIFKMFGYGNPFA